MIAGGYRHQSCREAADGGSTAASDPSRAAGRPHALQGLERDADHTPVRQRFGPPDRSERSARRATSPPRLPSPLTVEWGYEHCLRIREAFEASSAETRPHSSSSCRRDRNVGGQGFNRHVRDEVRARASRLLKIRASFASGCRAAFWVHAASKAWARGSFTGSTDVGRQIAESCSAGLSWDCFARSVCSVGDAGTSRTSSSPVC